MADGVLSLLTDHATPITLLVVIITLLYLYSTWTFDTWSKLGIPGPKPLPMIGNNKYLNEKGYPAFIELTQKYGKNVGMYMGRMPVLLTSDMDLIIDVMIKNVQQFYNKKTVTNNLMPLVFARSVVAAKDARWKRLRHAMAAFSISNLKTMQHFITSCCDNLLQAIENATEEGQIIDVKRTFASFTLDVIAGTGFGIYSNSVVEDGDEFFENVKKVLESWEVSSPAVALSTEFPFLAPLMKMMGIYSLKMKETAYVEKAVAAIIKEKKQNMEKSPDLLQQMLDLEASEEDVLKHPHKKQMTTDEIISGGLTFFIAGFETTATLLQFVSYLLALNPDKQEKLYHAIVDAVGDDKPTYENVARISYLDNCLHEALRMHPPTVSVERHANAPSTVNGIRLPAGVSVYINVVTLMRDEKYFPQPNSFIPERFDDTSRPVPSVLKELVFGAGPRHCLGSRLAILESKMALVTVLRKFRFVKVKETMVNFEPANHLLFSIPRTPIILGTERR